MWTAQNIYYRNNKASETNVEVFPWIIKYDCHFFLLFQLVVVGSIQKSLPFSNMPQFSQFFFKLNNFVTILQKFVSMLINNFRMFSKRLLNTYRAVRACWIARVWLRLADHADPRLLEFPRVYPVFEESVKEAAHSVRMSPHDSPKHRRSQPRYPWATPSWHVAHGVIELLWGDHDSVGHRTNPNGLGIGRRKIPLPEDLGDFNVPCCRAPVYQERYIGQGLLCDNYIFQFR